MDDEKFRARDLRKHPQAWLLKLFETPTRTYMEFVKDYLWYVEQGYVDVDPETRLQVLNKVSGLSKNQAIERVKEYQQRWREARDQALSEGKINAADNIGRYHANVWLRELWEKENPVMEEPDDYAPVVGL